MVVLVVISRARYKGVANTCQVNFRNANSGMARSYWNYNLKLLVARIYKWALVVSIISAFAISAYLRGAKPLVAVYTVILLLSFK